MSYKLSTHIALFAVLRIFGVVYGDMCFIGETKTCNFCEFDWRDLTECSEATEFMAKQLSCKTTSPEFENSMCLRALVDCNQVKVVNKFTGLCKGIKGRSVDITATLSQKEGKCVSSK